MVFSIDGHLLGGNITWKREIMNDEIKRKQVRPPIQSESNGTNGQKTENREKNLKDRERLKRAGQQIVTKLQGQRRNVTFKVGLEFKCFNVNGLLNRLIHIIFIVS